MNAILILFHFKTSLKNVCSTLWGYGIIMSRKFSISGGFLRSFRTVISIIFGLSLVFAFQNCTEIQSRLNPLQISSKNGNGGTYDGKLAYLQIQSGFTCEGKSAPSSILRSDRSGKWTQIINLKEKCAFQEKEILDPTNLNGQSVTQFQGQEFYLDNTIPQDISEIKNHLERFNVDAGSNTNDADNLPGDGLCETKYKNCSLLAAIQEANAIPNKARLIIVPEGVYELNSSIVFMSESFLGLIGAGKNKTIIKSRGDSGLFTTPYNQTSVTIIQDMTLSESKSTVSFSGSAINVFGALQLKNVAVKSNFNDAGNPAIRASVQSRDIYITDSIVADNQGNALSIFGPQSVTVVNSEISNNLGYGVQVSNGSWNIKIFNSKISGNNIGVEFRKCYYGCLIQDSIIAQNKTYGLMITGGTFLNEDPLVLRTTIAYNAQVSGANLYLAASLDTPAHLQFNNSTLARGLGVFPNCEISAVNRNFSILAQNSVADDSSCQGEGLRVVDPIIN